MADVGQNDVYRWYDFLLGDIEAMQAHVAVGGEVQPMAKKSVESPADEAHQRARILRQLSDNEDSQ